MSEEKKTSKDFTTPEEFAKHLGVDLTGPVTMKEITQVFRFFPLRQSVLIVERDMPPSQIGLIHVPDHIRKDRQTGASLGRILWAGKEAKERINELLSDAGIDYEARIDDSVGFNAIHPQPLSLMWNGSQIFPGDNTGRYAGIEVVHADDVLGYVPATDL